MAQEQRNFVSNAMNDVFDGACDIFTHYDESSLYRTFPVFEKILGPIIVAGAILCVGGWLVEAIEGKSAETQA